MFFDDAIAGSSGLRSAILQAFRNEIAELEKKQWALVLHDLTKFYDTIQLHALIAEALFQRYSPKMLSLILMTYTFVRRIRVGGCFFAAIQPTDSIVAGCGEANNMARRAK